MAYRKRQESKVETVSEVNLTALKSFDAANGSAINYGSSGKSLSSGDYEQRINSCRTLREELNTFLEGADSKISNLNNELKSLKRRGSELKSAVKSRFGPDSTEYDQMGGTTTSERKRPERKKKIVA